MRNFATTVRSIPRYLDAHCDSWTSARSVSTSRPSLHTPVGAPHLLEVSGAHNMTGHTHPDRRVCAGGSDFPEPNVNANAATSTRATFFEIFIGTATETRFHSRY